MWFCRLYNSLCCYSPHHQGLQTNQNVCNLYNKSRVFLDFFHYLKLDCNLLFAATITIFCCETSWWILKFPSIIWRSHSFFANLCCWMWAIYPELASFEPHIHFLISKISSSIRIHKFIFQFLCFQPLHIVDLPCQVCCWRI